MFCKQCGTALNDGEAFCPNCGTPAEKPAEVPVETPVETPIEAPVNVDNEEPKKTEGGKKSFKKIGLVAALVVVLGGVGVWAYTNFLQSGDDYFKTVVKNTVKSGAPGISEILSLNADEISFDEVGAEASLDIKIGEPLREIIIENSDEETAQYIDWIESAGLDYDISYKDMLLGLNAKLNANETDLVSADLAFDFENGGMYITIPEISDTAIKVPFDDYDMSEAASELQAAEEVMAVWPKASVIEELMVRYAEVIADEVYKVEKSKESVTVGDVTQKCTLLTVTLDEETALNMAEAVLKEARDDKELEKLIKDFSGLEAVGMDADEAYSEFREGIDEALEEIAEETPDTEDSIELLVWVNGKNEIIGIGEEQFTNSRFIVLDNGKNIASTISVEADGTSFSIDGNGKRSGNKLDMEYSVSAMGMEVLKLTISDFDEKKAEKGYINATFGLELGAGAGALLGASGDEMAELLSDFEIKLQLAQESATDYSAVLTINADGELFAEATLAAKKKSASDIVIPEKFVDAESENEMSEWVTGINLGALLDSLKSANASTPTTSAIEQAIGFLELAQTMNPGAMDTTAVSDVNAETIEF